MNIYIVSVQCHSHDSCKHEPRAALETATGDVLRLRLIAYQTSPTTRTSSIPPIMAAIAPAGKRDVEGEEGGNKGTDDVLELAERKPVARVFVSEWVLVMSIPAVPSVGVTGGEDPFDGFEGALGELGGATAVGPVEGSVEEGKGSVGDGNADWGDEAELVGVGAVGKGGDSEAVPVGGWLGRSCDGCPKIVQPPTPLRNEQLSLTVLMTTMADMREGVGN